MPHEFYKIRKKTPAKQLISEAKTFGYECREMKQDGNCFFHAVADQLKIQRIPLLRANHQTLRYRAMQYIKDHIKEYADFLDEDDDGDINNFIKKNLQTGTWADHIVISALSRALNVTIVIIRSDGADPTIFKQNSYVATLYVGNEVGLHYQSLIEKKGIIPTKSLQDYIKAAPVDMKPLASNYAYIEKNIVPNPG